MMAVSVQVSVSDKFPIFPMTCIIMEYTDKTIAYITQ